MSATRIGIWAAAIVVAGAVAIGVLTGGEDKYTISVPLETASGLKNGSAVRIGGLDRGKVRLRLDDKDRVVADLELEPAAGKVGRDARVVVVAANFLGSKRVEIEPGDFEAAPAPDGYTLPPGRATTPTDLDQVLGVFDADTRTRAQILLNEAGEAVVGRRVDIRTLFKEFPIGLVDASRFLRQIKTDNGTMRSLVERSDRFVAEAARERRQLSRLVQTAGESAETLSARRSELRATLARAPQTLRTLRTFTGELLATARELQPAAREVTATAPALRATLAQVDGFRRAAGPTLDAAVDVAPDLTTFATKATPTLREARPVVRALASVARDMVAVSETLDLSSDNIIAVLENWSRAIQFRDGLGHVFRGEASFSPDLILTMVDRLTKNPKRKREASKPTRPEPVKAKPQDTDSQKPSRTPRRPVGEAVEKLPKLPLVDDVVQSLPENPVIQQVDELLDGLLGGQAPKDRGRSDLLDFLLSP